jgi:hypothetical protein
MKKPSLSSSMKAEIKSLVAEALASASKPRTEEPSVRRQHRFLELGHCKRDVLEGANVHWRVTSVRRQPLGFPVLTLRKGGTQEEPVRAKVSVRPESVFMGERLFVTPSALGVAGLVAFRIGMQNQLVLDEPIPAEMFSPLSFGTDMNLATALIGQLIEIDYYATGPKPVVVETGLLGHAVQLGLFVEEMREIPNVAAFVKAQKRASGKGLRGFSPMGGRGSIAAPPGAFSSFPSSSMPEPGSSIPTPGCPPLTTEDFREAMAKKDEELKKRAKLRAESLKEDLAKTAESAKQVLRDAKKGKDVEDPWGLSTAKAQTMVVKAAKKTLSKLATQDQRPRVSRNRAQTVLRGGL